MKSLLWLAASILCLIAFTAVNVWIFKHRGEGFLNKYGNYPDYYILHETPAMTGFKKLDNGRLKLIISPKLSDSWTVRMQDGTESKSPYPNPIIGLKPGKHIYELTADGKKVRPLIITVTYVASETYKKRGNSTGDNFHISKTNYPIISNKRYGIYDFAFSESHFNKGEIAEAKKMIYGEMGVRESDNTKDRITKISKYLYERTVQNSGIPSDTMKYLTPMQQYRRMASGKDGGWCHNFAVVYSFFMTAAGVPTRLVSLDGDVNGVKTAGHIFAESFVAEEGKWAFSDMNSGLFMAESPEGSVYDTIDLTGLTSAGCIDKAVFVLCDKNGIKRISFAQKDFDLLEDIRLKPGIEISFLVPRAKRYSLSSLVSRYTFFPDLAYSPTGGNFRYYLKLVLLGLGFVSSISVLLTGWQIVANFTRKKGTATSGRSN